MIRNDYILRMIEEFLRGTARLKGLKEKESWSEAREEIEEEIKALFGQSLEELETLSEAELLGKLIVSDSAFIVKEKAVILATLLKELGDVAKGEGEKERAAGFYLKGFDLLLGLLNRGDIYDTPEYSPNVETFLSSLSDRKLPLNTLASLMQYFERTTNFGKAEDVLFEIAENDEVELVELKRFGTAFYERLMAQSEEKLASGGLPREEVQSGFADFTKEIEARA
jgi:hypothetical protein